MLEFILIAGSAAISLAVMRGMTGEKITGSMKTIVQLLAFGLVDLVAMLLLLHVKSYLKLEFTNTGVSLQIGGGITFAAAVVIAALVGVLMAFLSKRLSVRTVVEKNSEEEK